MSLPAYPFDAWLVPVETVNAFIEAKSFKGRAKIVSMIEALEVQITEANPAGVTVVADPEA